MSRIITFGSFPIKHYGTKGIERAYLLYALRNCFTIEFVSIFCRVVVDRFGSLAKMKPSLPMHA